MGVARGGFHHSHRAGPGAVFAASQSPLLPPRPRPPRPPPPPTPPPPVAAARDGVHAHRAAARHAHGLASVGEVNETNCCQWYKWCDNTNVTYQCTSALLTDCDAVAGAPGTWNATCKACGMCRDSQGGPAGMRKKAYLGINHAYQACIDTRRTVQTQAQIADPTGTSPWRNTRRSRATTPTPTRGFSWCARR